jgi:hypothetical protein
VLGSFDHLVGEQLHRIRNREAKGLRSVHVYNKLEFGRLLNRQIGWFLPLEDTACINAGLPRGINPARAITHETARDDRLAICKASWKRLLKCQFGDPASLAEGRSPKKGYLIDFIGNFARSAKEGLPIYRISGGAGFLWLASFDPIGRGILRSAAVDPSASHPSSLPSDAGVTGLDVQPATAERASTHPDVVARQEAEKAAEKAKSDADVARTEAETAKREVQLAQTEIERLSAETAKLSTALERLETDKNAVEGKARAMELVVYGAIIILIALLATISSILFVNRRRVIATNREGLGAEAKPLSPLVESPRASGGGDSAPAKTGNTASYSLNLTQSSSSDATAPKSQNGSGASDATSSSETDEGRVTLPI